MGIKIVEEPCRVVAIDEETGAEVGELTFTRTADGLASFDHTFVDPACRGQNVAERLLQAASEIMRCEGCKVIPVCSYVAVKFERDKQYDDIKQPE